MRRHIWSICALRGSCRVSTNSRKMSKMKFIEIFLAVMPASPSGKVISRGNDRVTSLSASMSESRCDPMLVTRRGDLKFCRQQYDSSHSAQSREPTYNLKVKGEHLHRLHACTRAAGWLTNEPKHEAIGRCWSSEGQRSSLHLTAAHQPRCNIDQHRTNKRHGEKHSMSLC